MFQKAEFGLATGGGSFAPSTIAALADASSTARWDARFREWAQDVDLIPDLGQNIGSRTWFRGLFSCAGICAFMVALAPGFDPVPGMSPAPLGAAQLDEARSQMVTALAYGADSGRHMGATDAVLALKETPERPSIDVTAAVNGGDSFAHLLSRAGVSATDARAVISLVKPAIDPDSIANGTAVAMTLGRRSDRSKPRPLDLLTMRARLDLAIRIERINGTLALTRIPIAVDSTPLRITGRVGDSLYRSARAAGADPASIAAYLKVMATRLSVGSDIAANDRFDIIVAHRQAETGEVEIGDLLYAGLQRDRGKAISMLKWTAGGRSQWFESSGVGEKRGVLARPVSGRQSSSFGMRRHPILGYTRMHAGIDFAAAHGEPIYAVTDGKVVYAGRHGGHGNFVKIDHGGGIATGYAHMSRIAASAGSRVRRGQVIGYVGSTGLSTGPHLHYELYRNGVPVNPSSIKFTAQAQLAGEALTAFRSRLAALKALPSGPRTMPQTPSALLAVAPMPGTTPQPAATGDPIGTATARTR